MVVGTVDALRRYPVKSLRGEVLDYADVASDGIPGDRASALIARSGSARAGKTYRGKEHDGLHLIADGAQAIAAAAQRAVDVELQHAQHFFDDAPVSLLVDRWLDGLNEHVGYRVEWERFRPNCFIRADAAFSHAESELVGMQLSVGTVRLLVRSPIERCVAVTYDPNGGPSDPEILRFLARRRNALIGIYCDVVDPGTAHVGDFCYV